MFFFLKKSMLQHTTLTNYNLNMNKDLVAINEEIDRLLQKPTTMEKYERLGVLFVCKYYIEKAFYSQETTIRKILEYKMENIGARATLVKLEPILSKMIKDLELIAPTMSGEFIKQIKEM